MLVPTTLINTDVGRIRISYIMVGMKVETPYGMIEIRSRYKTKYKRAKRRIILQDRTFVEGGHKTKLFLEDGKPIKINSLKEGMFVLTR